MSTSTPSPGAREFVTLLLTLVTTLAVAAAPTPLYGLWSTEFGFSTAHLTAVFAVYAATLLAVLLTCRDVPERLGRRRAALLGLAGLLASVLAFLLADGLVLLYLGRAVQGAATGLLTILLSAWLLDTEPRPGAGSLANAVAPTTGLAVGALLAGALTEWAPSPLRTTWELLLVVLVVAVLAVLALPSPPARRDGRSGAPEAPAPRARLDATSRAALARLSPVLAATWATGGLYLSLGPSLAQELAGRRDQMLGASATATLMLAAAVAVVLTAARWSPVRILRTGLVALLLGLAATLGALEAGSTVALLAATAVTGVGFGMSFSAAFARMVAAVPADQRATAVAVVFTVSYCAFSAPALAAGVAARTWALVDVAVVYAVGVAAVAALALALQLGSRARAAAPAADVSDASGA